MCSCGCHCTTFSCSSYPTQAHFRLNLIILAHHHEGKLSGYCAIIICEVTHVSLPFSLKFIPGFTFFRTVLRLYTIFLTPHLHKRVGHVGGPCPQRALQSVPPGPILHFKKQPYPTNFVLVFGLVSVQECVYLVLCLHISKVVCSLQTERRFFESWNNFILFTRIPALAWKAKTLNCLDRKATTDSKPPTPMRISHNAEAGDRTRRTRP